MMQEIQGLINPVPPQGIALIQTVEDLQGQTRLKVQRARQAIDDTIELLAEDLLTGTYWLDLRKTEDASRQFGTLAHGCPGTPFVPPCPCAARAPRPLLQTTDNGGRKPTMPALTPRRFYRDNAREPAAIALMIATACMSAVDPQAAELWRELLCAVTAQAGLHVEVIEHAPPAAIDDLWRRTDMAAVFMGLCALFTWRILSLHSTLARRASPAEFAGRPEYWSELVVRRDSRFENLESTFGGKLCLTALNSQSGYAAALQYLMAFDVARYWQSRRSIAAISRDCRPGGDSLGSG